VARMFTGDIEELKGLIEEAVNHMGFSLIDIL
jgi:pyruvate/2-oxoacid:ferredoxin oxidoreductase beta subunit